MVDQVYLNWSRSVGRQHFEDVDKGRLKQNCSPAEWWGKLWLQRDLLRSDSLCTQMRVVSAVDLQLMNQRFWEILLREEVIWPALKLKGWPAVQIKDELNNNHMITEKYLQLLTFKQIWAVMKLVGKYFWICVLRFCLWGQRCSQQIYG